MPVPVYNKRLFRKLALLTKLEVTYGTNSVPTAAANAILATEVTLTPIEGEEVPNDYYLPWLGDQGFKPAGLYARLEFSVDMNGAGTAGTAPAYGPLLRGCGMAQTLNAGVSAVYTPVSASFESLSTIFNMDGVQHILLGCRGTMMIDSGPLKLPRMKFTLTGLLGTITDVALPTPTLTAFRKANPMSKALTTLSLHGTEQVAESITFDVGAQVEPRMLIGEDSIQLVDRKVKGSVVVEAPPLATKNWFSIYQAATLGAFSLVHGTTAGEIVEITGANVQLGKPTMGQSQQIVNITLPLTFTPSGAGNDEFSIIVR